MMFLRRFCDISVSAGLRFSEVRFLNLGISIVKGAFPIAYLLGIPLFHANVLFAYLYWKHHLIIEPKFMTQLFQYFYVLHAATPNLSPSVSKLILCNAIGGTIMIINALFDFFFTGMSIMTMSCIKDLVIDGCPYFGQINTFTMKAWLNLTQYPSSKSYCN